MCKYNLKIYHQEDQTFHKVAHNLSRDEKDHLVSLCEQHNKVVLIECGTEEITRESFIDIVKLVVLGVSK